MKKILLIIAIAAFSFASAQDNGPSLKKLPPSTVAPKEVDLLKPVLSGAKLLSVLPNGNNVYALPQDNMPCVVPDMAQYNSMPVIKPDMSPYTMPNAASPAPLIPGTINIDKLKELIKEKKLIMK